jgi:hypothetical protein
MSKTRSNQPPAALVSRRSRHRYRKTGKRPSAFAQGLDDCIAGKSGLIQVASEARANDVGNAGSIITHAAAITKSQRKRRL